MKRANYLDYKKFRTIIRKEKDLSLFLLKMWIFYYNNKLYLYKLQHGKKFANIYQKNKKKISPTSQCLSNLSIPLFPSASSTVKNLTIFNHAMNNLTLY